MAHDDDWNDDDSDGTDDPIWNPVDDPDENPWARFLREVSGALASTATTFKDTLDDAVRATPAWAVSDLATRAAAFRLDRKMDKGTLRSTYVVPYRGFVADGLAHIQVRVMEAPVVPEVSGALVDPYLLQANLRRFITLAFSGAQVTVEMPDGSESAVTDRHGYAAVHLRVDSLESGWHGYTAITVPAIPRGKAAIASGEVVAPDPKAPFAVISDLDDTVIRTGMTEGLAVVRRTLFGRAGTRHAIPGMAALYSGLRDGAKGAAEPTFFYVSTGPWSLYDMHVEFLNMQGFPKGPLFLTDWGPQERRVMRSGQEHKRLTISRLFASFPNTKFLLIGDSGEHDPEIYVEAAHQYPDSVETIIIRDVDDEKTERATELARWRRRLARQGIDFNFVSDAGVAARLLQKRGLVTHEVIDAVTAALADPDNDWPIPAVL
ncbi:MAG: phosphatase domain-containing protein [Actinomycetes bacterium]